MGNCRNTGALQQAGTGSILHAQCRIAVIAGGNQTLKRILIVGAPLLISQMSQYLMTLADTAMVGRLGAVSPAAISIGSTTTWLFFVFVWPVSVGVQTVASRRFGRNQSRPDEPLALAPVRVPDSSTPYSPLCWL